tara:strand:+ start:99 stop:581 length:483 start_codon:yes stop_codon:yes gene_type:complete
MKTKILFITSLLLIVGCSKEPINYKTSLVERDDVYYTIDTNKPYSGQVFSLYMYGDKKDEGTLKDGRMISRTEWKWYEYKEKTSKKREEVPYKDGEVDGVVTSWYESGQKEIQGTFKNGNEDGLLTGWYENGQKRFEETYKDGELVEVKGRWNEDGSVIE